jgi:hypothetical protein
MGCYADNGNRDMSYLEAQGTYDIEDCIHLCHQENYLYAGLQAG